MARNGRPVVESTKHRTQKQRMGQEKPDPGQQGTKAKASPAKQGKKQQKKRKRKKRKKKKGKRKKEC